MYRIGLFLVLVAWLGFSAEARAGEGPQLESCDPGTFLVAGPPLLPNADFEPPDRVTLRDGTLALASGCPPVPVELHATRRGTWLRARWPECSDLARGVRLKARIYPGCQAMTGRLRIERPFGKRFFAAVREAVARECDVAHPCAMGEFCELPCGVCASALDRGTCVEVPEVCPELYQPVCGCDAQTYSNDCERRRALVSLAHDGPCGTATPCGPALACDGSREICVAREPVGPAIVYACEPVPAGCEVDRSCACAAEILCVGAFGTCHDLGPNAITCECPQCQ